MKSVTLKIWFRIIFFFPLFINLSQCTLCKMTSSTALQPPLHSLPRQRWRHLKPWKNCPIVLDTGTHVKAGNNEGGRQEWVGETKKNSYHAIIQSPTRPLIYSSLRGRCELEWEWKMGEKRRRGKRWLEERITSSHAWRSCDFISPRWEGTSASAALFRSSVQK